MLPFVYATETEEHMLTCANYKPHLLFGILAVCLVALLPPTAGQAQNAAIPPPKPVGIGILVQADKGVHLWHDAGSGERVVRTRLAMKKAPSPSYCHSQKGERWCVTRSGKCRCYDMAAIHNQLVRWNRRFAKSNKFVAAIHLKAEPDVPLRAASAMLEAARCHRGLAARDGTIRAPGKGFKTLKDYRRSVPVPNPNPSARSGCHDLVSSWINARFRWVPAAVEKSKNKSSRHTASGGKRARLLGLTGGAGDVRHEVGMCREGACIVKVPKGGHITVLASNPAKPNAGGQNSSRSGELMPPMKTAKFTGSGNRVKVVGGEKEVGSKPSGKVRRKALAIIGKVSVRGGRLDRAGIKKLIKRQKGSIVYCYKKGVQSNPDLKGKVVLKFNINPSGKVTNPGIQKSTLGSGSVESCIVSRLRMWRFPAPRNGGVVAVRFPVLLKTK